MADDKKNKIEDNDIDFNFGDFGNFDIPDLEIDAFDFVPDEISELESRYIKPKLKPMKKDYVLYDNALKFAKEAKIDFNERIMQWWQVHSFSAILSKHFSQLIMSMRQK